MAQTILVIDDSASLRQVVAMALKGAGYTVLEAGDGLAALALLDGRKIGMAVCDVNMPRMGGMSCQGGQGPAGLPLPAHPDADNGKPGVQEGRRPRRGRQGLDGQAIFSLVPAERSVQALPALITGAAAQPGPSMTSTFELPTELTIYGAMETRDALLAWATSRPPGRTARWEVSACR